MGQIGFLTEFQNVHILRIYVFLINRNILTNCHNVKFNKQFGGAILPTTRLNTQKMVQFAKQHSARFNHFQETFNIHFLENSRKI